MYKSNLCNPFGVTLLNPFRVPLINPVVLISSSIRVAWTPHSLVVGDQSQTKRCLIITALLRVYFRCLQALEYCGGRFRFVGKVHAPSFFFCKQYLTGCAY